MTLQGLQRLQTLVNHLKHGKHGHAHFDFGCYNRWVNEKWGSGPNECGTHGCALGELPIVWPDVFVFSGSRVTAKIPGIHDPRMWFELTPIEAGVLFYPGDNDEKNRAAELDYAYTNVPSLPTGMLKLPVTATREEVTANIQRFIDGWMPRFESAT